MTRIAFAALGLMLSSLACGPKTYPMTFVCEADGGPECPSGQECPVVPEGHNACGQDLPGVFGHSAIPIDMARPVGCRVGLPYGNPAFGDAQVVCTCSTPVTTTPMWSCPI